MITDAYYPKGIKERKGWKFWLEVIGTIIFFGGLAYIIYMSALLGV